MAGRRTFRVLTSSQQSGIYSKKNSNTHTVQQNTHTVQQNTHTVQQIHTHTVQQIHTHSTTNTHTVQQIHTQYNKYTHSTTKTHTVQQIHTQYNKYTHGTTNTHTVQQIFSTDFKKILISNFIKIRPVGFDLFHADWWTVRRTDRHDEANSNFLQFCKCGQKSG